MNILSLKSRPSQQVFNHLTLSFKRQLEPMSQKDLPGSSYHINAQDCFFTTIVWVCSYTCLTKETRERREVFRGVLSTLTSIPVVKVV